MEARKYYQNVTCQFVDQEACQLKASAVYISDDSSKTAIPMCWHHANKAELEGDGPVLRVSDKALNRAIESLLACTQDMGDIWDILALLCNRVEKDYLIETICCIADNLDKQKFNKNFL